MLPEADSSVSLGSVDAGRKVRRVILVKPGRGQLSPCLYHLPQEYSVWFWKLLGTQNYCILVREELRFHEDLTIS
jgi:hypothetical protein